MKLVPIHPFSLVLGAGLLAVVLSAVGAQAVSTVVGSQAEARAIHPGIPRVAIVHHVGTPDPRDKVVIPQGEPLEVPPGRLFVLTALGSTSSRPRIELRVDGIRELEVVGPSQHTVRYASLEAVPAGFTVAAGKVVSVYVPNSNDGRAWGYLVDV